MHKTKQAIVQQAGSFLPAFVMWQCAILLRVKERMVITMDGIRFANYGQLRDVDATDEEVQMFELIKNILDAPDLELVRKADNYVTAVLGEWDLARFKYSKRAKWIELPIVEYGKNRKKNRIEDVEDVNQYADKLKESLSKIQKFIE